MKITTEENTMANSKHGMTVYRMLTTCTGWDLADGSSEKKVTAICYQDVHVCASQTINNSQSCMFCTYNGALFCSSFTLLAQEQLA